jgi:hypothetical protein
MLSSEAMRAALATCCNVSARRCKLLERNGSKRLRRVVSGSMVVFTAALYKGVSLLPACMRKNIKRLSTANYSSQ